jgi:hypothetical protein
MCTYEDSIMKLTKHCLKNREGRAGRVAQVVEPLPGKHEALSSNHKRKKKEKKEARGKEI